MKRRSILKGIGVGSVSLISGQAIGQNLASSLSQPNKTPNYIPNCTFTPEQVEGPFYIDTGLVRHDITEGKPGAPLFLNFTVVDTATCAPMRDAVVDIWHANAIGYYSGFPEQGKDGDVDTTGEKFLRGTQITNPHGQCCFRTIYPGHYTGRANHIHLKVLLNQSTLVTTQLYFPDDLTDQVHQAPPYNKNTERRVRNDEDILFTEEILLNFKTQKQAYGYEAEFVLGVNTQQS
ncbi:intradiol ring-cleavage dioxygenase [Zooshikella marina]|uniref:intradiol ring-cleavage dioxygenase n=1 Tax=Zooshikella ganghwensis TaxID=202772 RepID=UPI001BAFF211|nr:intradiol ring-cleavage dioxygenase [Zooshikella ganghwensis]MBU2705412.1 intradiol ring-cleavage dioxygenase [Zooshikella ganghwensis]